MELADDAARAWREDEDAVAERDGFMDVMGDEDDRLSGRLPDRFELAVEPVARQRVERAEGFVHQQRLRLDRERSREGDALAHAAGKLVHEGSLVAGEVNEIEVVLRDGAALVLRHISLSQSELDVAEYVEPRGTAPRPGRVGRGLFPYR